MVRSLILGASLTGFWLLLSGHFSFEHTLLATFGAFSVVGVLGICRRMNIIDREGVPLKILWRAVRYAPWLLKEITLSNFNVVWRVWKKDIPISPTLVSLPASQKTQLGWVIYANSITLTPGTITLRLRDGVVLVHALTAEAAEELQRGEMDRRVSKLEGD